MPDTYLRTIQRFYPTALYFDQAAAEVMEYLRRIPINPDDVMTANSICSDDINSMQFPITNSDLLGPFYLGGLDGFPFTGLTGVRAFAHHMPKEGALMIYYGPHIGITQNGEIGKVLRTGQHTPSDCCGAAQAALGKINDPLKPNPLDYQQDTIIQLFQNNKQRILSKPKELQIQEATEVMFEAIQERIQLLIVQSPRDFYGKHLILIGTIFINVDDGAKPCVTYQKLDTINLETQEVTHHLEGFHAHLTAKNLI
jgi:hypothetical protein